VEAKGVRSRNWINRGLVCRICTTTPTWHAPALQRHSRACCVLRVGQIGDGGGHANQFESRSQGDKATEDMPDAAFDEKHPVGIDMSHRTWKDRPGTCLQS